MDRAGKSARFNYQFVQAEQANGRTKACVNCGEQIGHRHKIVCHALHKARQEARRAER